jgi:hypothetical protein
MSVELFRYRGPAKDGGTLEYVFEAGEQNSPNAVTKGKAADRRARNARVTDIARSILAPLLFGRARVLPPFEEIEIGEGRVTRARGIIGIDVRKKSPFTPLRLVHLNPMSEQAMADMWRIARFDLVARIDRNEPRRRMCSLNLSSLPYANETQQCEKEYWR